MFFRYWFMFVCKLKPAPNQSPEPTTISAFRDSARVVGCWMSIVRGGSAPNVRCRGHMIMKFVTSFFPPVKLGGDCAVRIWFGSLIHFAVEFAESFGSFGYRGVCHAVYGFDFTRQHVQRACERFGFCLSHFRICLSLTPNQSPEPTGIVALFLFALDFINSDATHCRWLSFFR